MGKSGSVLHTVVKGLRITKINPSKCNIGSKKEPTWCKCNLARPVFAIAVALEMTRCRPQLARLAPDVSDEISNLGTGERQVRHARMMGVREEGGKRCFVETPRPTDLCESGDGVRGAPLPGSNNVTFRAPTLSNASATGAISLCASRGAHEEHYGDA
jgi:hypothetical protein